ncbi:Ubiquitin carboxyl-terminal hydrolase 12 [Spatholobus suberectus]|nr:Ubiquitin carboxyl-terminal hydrolase 12 [Spatholobus suberectus]
MQPRGLSLSRHCFLLSNIDLGALKSLQLPPPETFVTTIEVHQSSFFLFLVPYLTTIGRIWQVVEMANQNTRDKMFEKFTWTIRDFSKLDKKLYSEKFSLDGHTWRILIFPKGNNVDYLSIYLDAAGDLVNLPDNWNKFANFKLALINQLNNEMTKIRECEHLFDARKPDWGFPSFIPLDELRNSSNGFIVNDTCIIEVEILVSKSKHENQPISKIDDKPIERTDNPLPKEMFTTFGELVDFKGLGKIEQDFVPLLEDVCLRHPSLIDSQQKRTRRFIEWAFTALGRVLHFLKTKKVKDMGEDACNHLQILWEELNMFRFDLTWLEPHVQSALGMKNYIERVVQVKKLKEDVATLEMETKRLKEKMIEAVVNLEIARRDLVKANEGFGEYNLDAELGYEG